MFVTMTVDGQMMGIEVKHVRDVLREQKITPVPLAPPEVAGSLNLRGRIVTVIDLRRRLGLQAQDPESKCHFVVVDLRGELYSLMVDSVGDVLTSRLSHMEKPPGNLGAAWKEIATGVYKLDGRLIVLMDVQTLLKM
ncbi:MAG: chemotaxis protein CheW [Proteobacteria bacterium]|nr:chemotaxis protein CheW [Pseudomonadota bacterium]